MTGDDGISAFTQDSDRLSGAGCGGRGAKCGFGVEVQDSGFGVWVWGRYEGEMYKHVEEDGGLVCALLQVPRPHRKKPRKYCAHTQAAGIQGRGSHFG